MDELKDFETVLHEVAQATGVQAISYNVEEGKSLIRCTVKTAEINSSFTVPLEWATDVMPAALKLVIMNAVEDIIAVGRMVIPDSKAFYGVPEREEILKILERYNAVKGQKDEEGG